MFLYQHVYLTASLGGGERQWGERGGGGGWLGTGSEGPVVLLLLLIPLSGFPTHLESSSEARWE